MHRATDSFCYPLDSTTLHIRVLIARGEAESVLLVAGDPHEWERQKTGGDWGWKSLPHPMVMAGSTATHDVWEIYYQPPYKRARYSFLINSGSQVFEYGEKGVYETGGPGDPPTDFWNSFVFPYINQVDVFSPPSWVSETIWYQIFPERFARANGSPDMPGLKDWHHGPVTNREYYGGNLRGITEKLDHIAGLGCTGLYLTPIFASPSVHKYDTTDYLVLDPAFGSDQDLHDLVQGCHDRGIRIMLDAVFNHCGRQFGPWQDVVARGADSPWASWFHARFPLFPQGKDTGDRRDANFETFSFTTSMPKFNTEDPGARDYLLGVAEYYVKTFDIDGWRLDVANEIDHEFWRLLRKRVRAIKPDVYLLGEIWHDAMAWLRGDQYDAVMNYPYGTAICDFLLERRYAADGEALSHRLNSIEASYPLPVLRSAFNLLDSHDTDRLITRFGGNKDLARAAWFMLVLLPGSPCVYYGSEFGLEGGSDPDNRRCMPWDPAHQDLEMLAFFRALLSWRGANHNLCKLGRRQYWSDSSHPERFALRLSLGDRAVVALVDRKGGLPADCGMFFGNASPDWYRPGTLNTRLVGTNHALFEENVP